MQQYFCDERLAVGDEIILSKDITNHLIKVLRKDNRYIFRLVDKNHQVFFAHLNTPSTALVVEESSENNELEADITVILSLIRNENFDLCIQKLTELGVKRIVPFNAKRSVAKPSKKEGKLERYRKIAREAAEQSHRNLIPEITDYITIKQLPLYLSEYNFLPYEKEDSSLTSFDIKKDATISYIIGPEGGFDKEEIDYLKELGFVSLSLGKRILRAETAAIYLTSLITGKLQ